MKNKVCAIICEYNPMHTGHIHQINEIKKLLGNDIYIVSLISGNFSQRANPCILNKYDRTAIALNNGIDMVVGLPTLYTIQSAEIFAYSSVKILNQMKVDYLCFGMETPNQNLLYTLAKFLVEEPICYKEILKAELKKGNDYNSSVKKAILKNYDNFKEFSQEEIINMFTYPNNILALEYVKALIKTNSKIKPLLIKRANNYNNKNIVENYVSSSALRNAKNILDYKEFLPANSLHYFNALKLNLEKYQNYLFFNLKMNNINKNNANSYLHNRINNLLSNEYDANNFYNNVKTKCFKQSFIDSYCLNAMLGIQKERIKKIYTIKTNIIIKVLGIKRDKQDILRYICCKNLILRKNDASKIKPNSYNGFIQITENKANILYNISSENSQLCENDYFTKLLVI